MSKWKSRRETRDRVLRELVFKILLEFPSGLQYNDLASRVNEETRHNFSRNGISQKFKKQKANGLIILEPIPNQGNSFSWKLAEGVDWNQFHIGEWKPLEA